MTHGKEVHNRIDLCGLDSRRVVRDDTEEYGQMLPKRSRQPFSALTSSVKTSSLGGDGLRQRDSSGLSASCEAVTLSLSLSLCLSVSDGERSDSNYH